MKFKLSLFFGLAILIVACKVQAPKRTIILKSGLKDIKYSINGKRSDWHISPELKPDVLKVECLRDSNAVGFKTDVDSIFFSVSVHDTISFIVLLNGRDTAYTQIIGIEKNVNFSAAYIQEHKGKFEVAVPEVHELANILVAIGKIGQLDSNMVDMTTPYYKKVMQTFLPFANHPAVAVINKNITKVMDDYSYGYYYALKMNACGYVFNEQNEIINKGNVKRMGFDAPDDPFLINSKIFADFAKVSNFRMFYQANKNYYDSLVALYRQLNPIDKMQKWLEKKFGFSYGNYCVYFSPLIGGAHATTRFADNGFEQTYMFVCRAEKYPNRNDALNEMINSRVVFTEIDHNFINPVTDKYTQQVNKAFADRKKWVKETSSNGTSMYGSPYAVFNEYMTFAFYSLYCLENFNPKDVLSMIQIMEKMMADGRSFIHFKAFNEKLISLYASKKSISVDELYREMLNWSEKQ